MHLPTLLAESEVPRDVHLLTEELIARKAVTRELGTGPVPDLLRRFAADELDRADVFESASLVLDRGYVRDRANQFFRAQLALLAWQGRLEVQRGQGQVTSSPPIGGARGSPERKSR